MSVLQTNGVHLLTFWYFLQNFFVSELCAQVVLRIHIKCYLVAKIITNEKALTSQHQGYVYTAEDYVSTISCSQKCSKISALAVNMNII